MTAIFLLSGSQSNGGHRGTARTERRTETGSSSKDDVDVQDDAVNKPARKSVLEVVWLPQKQLSYKLLSVLEVDAS